MICFVDDLFNGVQLVAFSVSFISRCRWVLRYHTSDLLEDFGIEV